MKVVEKTQTLKLKMFVGGRWVDSESRETFDALSPATGELIATIPKGNRADAARAVEAAHQARASMAGLGAFDRAALLHRVAEAMERHRDELAHWLSLDQGKPHKAEAVGEVGEAIEYFRIAAEDIKQRLANLGSEPQSTTPAEFEARLKQEVAFWGKVIEDARIDRQ